MWWYKSRTFVTVVNWIICCCSTVKKHTHIKYILHEWIFQSTYFLNIVIRWLGSNETHNDYSLVNCFPFQASIIIINKHGISQTWWNTLLFFLRQWLSLIPKRVIIIIIVIVENSQLNSINITLLLVTLVCLGVVSFLSLSPCCSSE